MSRIWLLWSLHGCFGAWLLYWLSSLIIWLLVAFGWHCCVGYEFKVEGIRLRIPQFSANEDDEA
jgi:hypothetical protein